MWQPVTWGLPLESPLYSCDRSMLLTTASFCVSVCFQCIRHQTQTQRHQMRLMIAIKPTISSTKFCLFFSTTWTLKKHSSRFALWPQSWWRILEKGRKILKESLHVSGWRLKPPRAWTQSTTAAAQDFFLLASPWKIGWEWVHYTALDPVSCSRKVANEGLDVFWSWLF